MPDPLYALVAYVRNPIGEFIQNLRRELHPDFPHLPAHVTILPPRCLSHSSPDGEGAALEALAEACRCVDPFEITLGDVETFVPVTPTVFIRVAHGAYRLRELHDRLNSGILQSEEQWPYMPHLTIVKMASEQQALAAFDLGHERWDEYRDTRRVALEELTFVRDAGNGAWVDLAQIKLGRAVASG